MGFLILLLAVVMALIVSSALVIVRISKRIKKLSSDPAYYNSRKSN